MDNNKSKKILEQSYADILAGVVDHILFHDEAEKAVKLLKTLQLAMSDNAESLKSLPNLSDFYKQTIIKLKYISLPNLEDKEVVELIKNNFIFQLRLKDYSFFEKLNGKLVNIYVVEDRNVFKENLKKAILENNEKITANYEIKTIRDWLKNYVSVVGLEVSNNLAKAQYLIDLKNKKGISPEEHQDLGTLFRFYDMLNVLSDSPEGLEEELPVAVDGKLYIFRKGVLELVGEASRPPVTEPVAPLARVGKDVNSQVSAPQPLAELEQSLKNYSPASLEYKAIKQEIGRMERLLPKDNKKTVAVPAGEKIDLDKLKR